MMYPISTDIKGVDGLGREVYLHLVGGQLCTQHPDGDWRPVRSPTEQELLSVHLMPTASSQLLRRNCRCECGSEAQVFLCNPPVTELRPLANLADYWAECVNRECPHSSGEGYGPNGLPSWVVG